VTARRDTPQLHRLLDIIARLRAPGGCPWDREQTAESMAPHLLEEAFEAVDAIRRRDPQASCEELGDVLMNVLMIAQIAGESAGFTSEDVARLIADKLVRRHPHVFGDVIARDSDQVLQNWEQIKRHEKDGDPRGALDGLPIDLPALLLAFRMGEKAARVGFDWPDRAGPRRKVDEELLELDAALADGAAVGIEAELGDVLFSLCNLARHAGVNPELALRSTADRFKARFREVERALGDRLAHASLEEMETAWQAAKQRLER
jgi:MazG family protein